MYLIYTQGRQLLPPPIKSWNVFEVLVAEFELEIAFSNEEFK